MLPDWWFEWVAELRQRLLPDVDQGEF